MATLYKNVQQCATMKDNVWHLRKLHGVKLIKSGFFGDKEWKKKYLIGMKIFDK